MSFAWRLLEQIIGQLDEAPTTGWVASFRNLKSWALSGFASASNAIHSFTKKFSASSESNRARVPLVLPWRVRRIRGADGIDFRLRQIRLFHTSTSRFRRIELLFTYPPHNYSSCQSCSLAFPNSASCGSYVHFVASTRSRGVVECLVFRDLELPFSPRHQD